MFAHVICVIPSPLVHMFHHHPVIFVKWQLSLVVTHWRKSFSLQAALSSSPPCYSHRRRGFTCRVNNPSRLLPLYLLRKSFLPCPASSTPPYHLLGQFHSYSMPGRRIDSINLARSDGILATSNRRDSPQHSSLRPLRHRRGNGERCIF